MQKNNNQFLFSASDIANFLECEHLTYLDRLNLDQPMQKTANSEDAVLIQNKGLKHEADYLSLLKATYPNVVNVIERVGEAASLTDKVQATIDAIKEGADVIFQATFLNQQFLGHADFLRKVSTPSLLGDYSYEVIDTKLSSKTHGKFIIQLMFYSKLLAEIQGTYPKQMYIKLGTNIEEAFYCADYQAYFEQLLSKFLASIDQTTTYPDPCSKCDLCHWRERCEQQRLDDDHLCQVANINKSQITKLKNAGVNTLKDLALLADDVQIPKLNLGSLRGIQHQARLQYHYRTTGEAIVDILPIDESEHRGFLRLPKADIGDLYFDMEGNPLEDGGHLEYLFGIYYLDNGKPTFKGFWALTHLEEKKTFEAFMDFVTAHLANYPNAHIYHYASYEETAIKRLMSQYGTKEFEVDNLLRHGKLIDLYKVVREGIKTSEPKYSIKSIEHFYLEKRQGEVTNAGASIIYFENWKATGDQKYLDDIEAYNIDDVRSTMELHKWLLTKRPTQLPWFTSKIEIDPSSIKEPNTPAAVLREQQLERYRGLLIGHADIPESEKDETYRLKELTFQLMDFHRREAKPSWWDFFVRVEKNEDELIEDSESIAGLTIDTTRPPESVKRSIMYHFNYPAQETKIHAGSNPVIIATQKAVSGFSIDPDARKLRFKVGANVELPEKIALGPGKPIDAKVLSDAIQRYVDHYLDNPNSYKAIQELLARKIPDIKGLQSGQKIISDNAQLITQAIQAISSLNDSYLIIQGPPGTGKTYTGSKIIVDLLKQGKRVGIASNSHKAINNLLVGVDKEAVAQQFSFAGVKKGSETDTELSQCENITVAEQNDVALSEAFQLVAGTAWLFSREEANQTFDYLFVDEAGQVALANIVAMGTAASNIVLLGDQMQLGQPTQGVHPGDSGTSVLDFLLEGHHTVQPERGIFLGVSYRMHPKICQFISDTVYDGRLMSSVDTENQALELNANAHKPLKPNGIVYLPIQHSDCTQSSDEEAALIQSIYENLLTQHYINKAKQRLPITHEDILVVTPYNLQVQKLKSVLPNEAKIGTVDKFQGQEAPVVLYSMVTSSGDDLPRDIEFLFSKNRLNVAISRAKALIVFIANPNLMGIRCNKPEDMALVNTLCLLKAYEH